VNDRNVSLTWTTSSEENNAGFEIERSKAGVPEVWVKAGFVAGSGNSNAPVEYSFDDINLSSGRYSYRLRQIDYSGNFTYHDLDGEIVIGVPERFVLHQNFPNPFNPSTKINFDIPSDGRVTLVVYDSRGSEMSRPEDNRVVAAGYYTSEFGNAGRELSSGVYYAVLTFTPSGYGQVQTSTIKMALLK
jgi:hypothetical protein